MADSIGDPRKTYPIPLRLRNPNVEKGLGGSKGYRGAAFAKARMRALRLAKNRSTVTGLTDKDAQLTVDHIIPYRIGGLNSHTNRQTNLRVTDAVNNRYVDFAEGFQEKPRKRRLEKF